ENTRPTPAARRSILGVYAGSLLSVPLILLLVSNSDYTDLFMYTIGPLALLYFLWDMRTCSRIEIRELFAALIFSLFSVFFWAFFEQSGGSLAIVAEYHVASANIAGVGLTGIQVNNTANSIYVILFSPLL